MQSSEHLTIEKNGSGTLEVHLVVPEATRSLVDSTLGGMMQGMAQAFEGMATATGAKTKSLAMPKSVADEMFGNKEDILKKAAKAGLDLEFLSFKKEVREKSLYVDYKLKFNDINKLIQSRISGTRFSLIKDDKGRLVCFLEKDPQKAKEDQQKAEQFKADKLNSAKAGSQDPMAKKMQEAMSSFKVEFIVTMPNGVEQVSGPFQKQGADGRTAGFVFSGNFLEDPSILEKMNGMAGEIPQVSCSAEGLTFDVVKNVTQQLLEASAPESAALTQKEQAPSVFASLKEGQEITLDLASGTKVTGKLVEKKDDAVKIDCAGVPVTYFREEVKGVAQN
jgi:hypothetical protein